MSMEIVSATEARQKMGTGASSQISPKPESTNDISTAPLPHSASPDSNAKEDALRVTPNGSATAKRDSVGSHKVRNTKLQKATENTAVVSLTTQSVSTSRTQALKQSQKQTDTTAQNLSNSELHKKIKELEHELAKSESHRLDLMDQVQALEEKCKSGEQSDLPALGGSVESFSETLHAKDQYISKLETDLKNAQSEFNKIRLKLKKRIRVLTNQLHEVRQEASIAQMEMKTELTRQMEKNSLGITASNGEKGMFGYTEADDAGHSKVIVELSNQLSEQAEQIAKLESELAEKNLQIEELERTIKEMPEKASTYPGRSAAQSAGAGDRDELTSTDRLHSSRGRRPMGNPFSHSTKSVPSSYNYSNAPASHMVSETSYRDSLPGRGLERQSTALSDSDSDWELDSVPSHTQSAPARSRVKSALSTSSSTKMKDDIMSMQGDDDNFVDVTDKFKVAAATPGRRGQSQKKSTLRTRLEKEKYNKQIGALMGPSVAFAASSKEPPSDTSCEPTPRYSDPSKLPGFSKLKVVHPPDY